MNLDNLHPPSLTYSQHLDLFQTLAEKSVMNPDEVESLKSYYKRCCGGPFPERLGPPPSISSSLRLYHELYCIWGSNCWRCLLNFFDSCTNDQIYKLSTEVSKYSFDLSWIDPTAFISNCSEKHQPSVHFLIHRLDRSFPNYLDLTSKLSAVLIVSLLTPKNLLLPQTQFMAKSIYNLAKDHADWWWPVLEGFLGVYLPRHLVGENTMNYLKKLKYNDLNVDQHLDLHRIMDLKTDHTRRGMKYIRDYRKRVKNDLM
jgi:hypothetical protein